MPYFTCPKCQCREPQRENEVRCEHITEMIHNWKSGKMSIVEAYENLKQVSHDISNLQQKTREST